MYPESGKEIKGGGLTYEHAYIIIFCLGIVLVVLLGFLPLFKNYLSNDLKKMPYICGKSSVPGDSTIIRSGSVKKDVFSTILPYVPQRGVIRFVPAGVYGIPLMKVRAIKGRRMALTNIEEFAGRENILFDGKTIESECKKFETNAAVNISVIQKEWTYECILNKEEK